MVKRINKTGSAVAGIKFYWVLPSFTEFSYVGPSTLSRFTEFQWVLLGFTGFCMVLLGLTGFHWVLPSFTEFSYFCPSTLLSCTGL